MLAEPRPKVTRETAALLAMAETDRSRRRAASPSRGLPIAFCVTSCHPKKLQSAGLSLRGTLSRERPQMRSVHVAGAPPVYLALC